MTALVVDRLSASAPDGQQDRVRRLLADVAEHRLAGALTGLDLPEGHWCVRRVEARLDLGAASTDTGLEHAWAQALVGALDDRLTTPSADVVHYARITDALADLVSSLASGGSDRDWAWRGLGLLTTGDPDPAAAPRDAVLAALGRHPTIALAAVVRAAESAGAAALHRLVGGPGWARIATIVAAARGGRAPGILEPFASEVPREPAVADAARSIVARSRLAAQLHRCRVRVDAATVSAWALLVAAEAEPSLLARREAGQVLRAVAGDLARGRSGDAGRFPPPGDAAVTERSPGVADGAGPEDRPLPTGAPETGSDGRSDRSATRHDRGPNQALDTAAGALPPRDHDADPEAAPAEPAPAEPAQVETALAEPAQIETAPIERGAVPGDPAQARDLSRSHGDASEPPKATPAGPSPDGRSPQEPSPEEQSPEEGAPDVRSVPGSSPEERWPTEWAGLVFLLSTAVDAGLPADLLAEDAAAGHPLSWMVHQLGKRLVPAEPTDPALLALAGLSPSDQPPRARAGASVHALLDEYAARWVRATAHRLGAPVEDGLAVVARVARRTGAISGGSGWLEVHLPLSAVDLTLRRAGLDVDPGWVPWLGAVVVIRYE